MESPYERVQREQSERNAIKLRSEQRAYLTILFFVVGLPVIWFLFNATTFGQCWVSGNYPVWVSGYVICYAEPPIIIPGR